MSPVTLFEICLAGLGYFAVQNQFSLNYSNSEMAENFPCRALPPAEVNPSCKHPPIATKLFFFHTYQA